MANNEWKDVSRRSATLVSDGEAPVPGLYNFRGTGEWILGSGTVTAARLFRSESPARLDAEGVAALTALGIDLIIDLRSEREVAVEGYTFEGVRRIGMPVDLLDPADLLDALTLRSLYERLVDAYGAVLATAVRAIARHDGGGVLVHCTAGKDRTGVVIALALLALGVSRPEVVADYAATHQNLRGAWTKQFLARAGMKQPPDHLLEIINGSPGELLEHIIDHVESAHGSIEAYLLAHGVTRADLNALRIRLVTPQGAS